VLIMGALAYFVMPADLLPEVLVGTSGFLEDLVLSSAVVAHALTKDVEPLVVEHWSGSEPVRVALADVSQAASTLLGANLYARLRSFLARRGIRLD
jgi:uncharacterized membrane protein YkvA (DUF1232 family)